MSDEAIATVRHIVLFWLRNPASAEDRDRLVAGLATLRAIGAVQSLHIGMAAATERRAAVDHSFDVSEVMTFASVADQRAYQEHPIHLKFVEDCAHLWGKHVVYDMVDIA
jgi:predicted DNA-binding protein with PD1-like motif